MCSRNKIMDDHQQADAQWMLKLNLNDRYLLQCLNSCIIISIAAYDHWLVPVSGCDVALELALTLKDSR